MNRRKICLTLAFTFLIISLLIAPNIYAEITRGPYLQPTEDMLYTDQTTGELKASVGVAWRTANGGTATIYYGIDDVNENSLDVEPVEAIEGDNTVYKYYIKLQNLTPGAIYKYRIEGDNDIEPQPGEGSNNTDYYEFKTSPPDGRFKLLVGADWQFPAAEWHRKRFLPVYSDMLEFDPDVVLLAGDNVERGDSSDHYEEMFSKARELFATAIVVPVLGNHEGWIGNGWSIFKEQFYLPGTEFRFSFDYGNVHFVILPLNSQELSSSDATWLDNDLNSANLKKVNFTIASRHFPTYLDTKMDRELTLHQKIKLSTIYDKYDVDIEFTGHRHVHQRTFPISKNPFDAMQWGIIYTPEKNYYNADTKGTIYHQISSLSYFFTATYNDLYFASGIPYATEGNYQIGYTQVVFDGKKATIESYSYKYNNSGTIKSSRSLQDRYIINKADTTEPPAPVISNVKVAELGAYRAVVEWDTDIASRGQVEFGETSGSYTWVDMREDQNQVFKTVHKAYLQALKPGTTYYFRVKAWRAGKEAVSEEYSFTTNSQPQPGELVAEFDFGPIMFAPEGVRVSPVSNQMNIGSEHGFDFKLRHGWYTKKLRQYPWTHFGVHGYAKGTEGFPPDASGTYISAGGKYQPTWAVELSKGEYDVEVTMGNYYAGPPPGNEDVRYSIIFQDASLNLERPDLVEYKTLHVLEPYRPRDTWHDIWVNTLWTWHIRLSVEKGFLHVELHAPINRLRIWAKGHYIPDTEPPVANAGPDRTVEVGTEVSFDGSGSTDESQIVYYHWDFDDSDGIQVDAKGPKVKHRYDKVGTYVVTLTVSDGIVQNGVSTDTLTVKVVPESTPPVTQAMPKGRTYSTTVKVTLLSNEPATIYYSTDGNDPGVGASNTISGPSPLGGIVIDSTTTLKFFAIDSAGNKEDVKTEVYTIRTNPLHTYYVDPQAPSGGDGSSDNPFQTIPEALSVATAGDTIILRDGTYSYNSSIYTQRGGNAADGPITIKAENRHKAILTRKGEIMRILHPYITLEGLVLDGQFSTFSTGRILWVRTNGDNFHLKDTILRNSRAHIINLVNSGSDYLEDVTIEGSLIHSALNFSIDENGNLIRSDAHGISTEGVRNLTIINTEIYDVSGDCLQPEYEGWDNILVTGVHFWSRPIPGEVAQALADGAEDQRLLQLEGKYPGENAIDTKQREGIRGRITIADSIFNGWHSDFISTCAALNLKHNITAIVERCLLYDNEYAFRLRGKGSKPSAHVTVKNCVVYDNDIHIRPEDKIENLHIYNNTFGPTNIKILQQAPTNRGIGEDFQAFNNLFIEDIVPPEMTHSSNVALDVTDVVDAANRDYHLVQDSRAIDTGVEIKEVVTDKDKNKRPQGAAYDIGAYEYTREAPLPGDVNKDGKVNLQDLVIIAVAFGSSPGDANWNERTDIADPRGIIDISDLVLVARNFGTV